MAHSLRVRLNIYGLACIGSEKIALFHTLVFRRLRKDRFVYLRLFDLVAFCLLFPSPFCLVKRLPCAAANDVYERRLHWHLFEQNSSALVNFMPPGKLTAVKVSFVLEKFIEMVRSVLQLSVCRSNDYYFSLIHFTNVWTLSKVDNLLFCVLPESHAAVSMVPSGPVIGSLAGL